METLKDFAETMKHAPRDVQRLRNDLTQVQALCTLLQTSSTTGSENRAVWDGTLALLNETADETNELAKEFEKALSGPALPRIRARIRKYFSSEKIKDISRKMMAYQIMLTAITCTETRFAKRRYWYPKHGLWLICNSRLCQGRFLEIDNRLDAVYQYQAEVGSQLNLY